MKGWDGDSVMTISRPVGVMGLGPRAALGWVGIVDFREFFWGEWAVVRRDGFFLNLVVDAYDRSVSDQLLFPPKFQPPHPRCKIRRFLTSTCAIIPSWRICMRMTISRLSWWISARRF